LVAPKWKCDASANEIVGSLEFQTNLDSGSRDDASKEPLDRPITPNEVTPKKKGRASMSLNTFQPWLKIT
jgi:hypothetical protein